MKKLAGSVPSRPGRYQWHRIPFGITSAPELFQMKLDQNLEGLRGVFKIADDVLITGQGDTAVEADQDHDRDYKTLLDRCRERNIKLHWSLPNQRSSEAGASLSSSNPKHEEAWRFSFCSKADWHGQYLSKEVLA